ncbi:terminase small subunit [uncultured Allofournierella sp.]|uniref:terminase small subunit n=1 Tax=uncultured Allofournierella sp. TaxID=1940258 RepID=UPI0037536A65
MKTNREVAALSDALKPKYKAFADAYLSNGGNAYRAALTAKYSENFARAKSYQLLDREDIQDYITYRRKQMARRAVSPERVLLELAAIGFANATEVAKIEGGELVLADTEDVPADTRKAIVGIKQGQSGIEIKMADKIKALELIGRNLGMWESAETNEQEGVTIVDDIPE